MVEPKLLQVQHKRLQLRMKIPQFKRIMRLLALYPVLSCGKKILSFKKNFGR
jgi:hypothetical protein